MDPFESLGKFFYSPSILTMALSCIISEIKRDIGQKSRFFHTSLASDAPDRGGGSESEYCHAVGCGKTRMMGLPDDERV